MSDAGGPVDPNEVDRLPTSVPQWQSALATKKDGRALLDHLISRHDAERLVKSLPAEDLHRAFYEIGLDDSTELIAMASSDQIRAIIDHEAWVQDTLDNDRLQPWLNALMQAGPDTLGARLLDLDDSLLNWIVRRSIRVQVIEDPDSFDPPDIEHVVTPDNRMVIYFPNGLEAEDETELAEIRERDLPLKVFLDWLMRVDSVLCVDLLLHSSAALDSTIQEDAHRWRKGRMEDRGYVDYYDALKVYTAPRPDQIRTARHVSADGTPPGSRWLRPLMSPDVRLGRAFAKLDNTVLDDIQQSLAYLVNMALSADRVEPWDQEHQAEVMRRVHAGLSLGLDVLAGPAQEPSVDAGVLASVSLTMVFRVGYGRMLEAAKQVRVQPVAHWLRRGDDAVGALGLEVLGNRAGALANRHPARPDGDPLATADDLDIAQRTAELVADLARVAGDDRPEDQDIVPWIATGLARSLVGLEGFGPLPVKRFEEAHSALFAAGALRPDAQTRATEWWKQVGGETTLALATVLRALTDDLAAISPADLEPRFAPLFIFGESTS